METHEISLGEVTYEIDRCFTGSHSVQELLLERLAQADVEKTTFDVDANPAV